jgi:hypothetical protein
MRHVAKRIFRSVGMGVSFSRSCNGAHRYRDGKWIVKVFGGREHDDRVAC